MVSIPASPRDPRMMVGHMAQPDGAIAGDTRWMSPLGQIRSEIGGGRTLDVQGKLD
jgi:hypothetical protein